MTQVIRLKTEILSHRAINPLPALFVMLAVMYFIITVHIDSAWCPPKFFTLPPVAVRSIAMGVCLYVCPLVRLESTVSKLHVIFCTRYLWPWLGLSLTTMQYVIYFRFCG